MIVSVRVMGLSGVAAGSSDGAEDSERRPSAAAAVCVSSPSKPLLQTAKWPKVPLASTDSLSLDYHPRLYPEATIDTGCSFC